MYELPTRSFQPVTVTGYYRTRRPMHCDHSDVLCIPHQSYNNFSFIYHSCLVINQQIHLEAKQEKVGEEFPVFFLEVSLSYRRDF
jgi:hypothetical protein